MNRVSRADDRVKVRTVLISVSDKSGLETLVPALASDEQVTIISTGGTHDRIAAILPDRALGRLRQVSDYTGQPEMQGGLVKTLDYRIYLGILSEPYNEDHHRDRERTGAALIDMVVVNLYPFERVTAAGGCDAEDARGNIDIGGPCMLRAAAKSFLRVAAVCDPADYALVTAEFRANGGTIGIATRYRLACKAFEHTARYDRAIADYLAGRPPEEIAASYRIGGGSRE